MFKGGPGVGRRPGDDDVDHDAEAVELVFLPGLVVLAELAALPVEDVAGQRVAAFAPAEHVMDRAAICRVVDAVPGPGRPRAHIRWVFGAWTRYP